MDEATSKLWFNPHNDKHVTIKPIRVTSQLGVAGTLTLRHVSIPLPNTTARWAVYELGNLNPSRMGIEGINVIWRPLPKMVTDYDVLAMVYFNSIQVPLSQVYIRRGYDGNILLAVNPNMIGEGELYFRLYSNLWNYVGDNARADPIRTYDAVISDNAALTAAVNSIQIPSVGTRWLYHNGYYVDRITSADVEMGDTIGYIEDRYGRGYIDVPLSEAKSFNSTLDGRGKYMISMPVESNAMAVEPGDELEIYICTVEDAAVTKRTRGVFYGVHKLEDLRMITHRDIALDARRVDLYSHNHPWLRKGSEIFLRVFYRFHENPDRTLLDGAYLMDLFRVDKSYRDAMITGSGGVTGWRANELEESMAVLWQTRPSMDLSAINVHGVLSKPSLGELLSVGTLYQDSLDLPYSMNLGGKVLCFNIEGHLSNVVNVRTNAGGSRIALPPATFDVECIPGKFITDGDVIDEPLYGGEVLNWYNEVFYYQEAEGTGWIRAVVEADYKVDPDTSKVYWTTKHLGHGKMRRGCHHASHNRLTVDISTVYYGIPLFKDNNPVTKVQFDRCDVFVNNKPIVRGIDYTVTNNNVYLTYKGYMFDDPTATTILVDVFSYGVGELPSERIVSGYVEGRKAKASEPGMFISNRNRTCVVDGRKMSVTDIGPYEDPNLLASDTVREGAPWACETRPCVLSLPEQQKYISDMDYPEVVSRAMWQHMPLPDESKPVVIPKRHVIFSPFIKKLIVRIAAGLVNVSNIGTSSAAVSLYMESLMDELVQDIAYLNVDNWMVDIHPVGDLTATTLTVEEFAFLREVNRLFFKERITFNTYITVT